MLKNWKTTLLGIVGAIVTAGPNLWAVAFNNGAFDLKALLSAVVILVLGAVAKDFNVSGT